MQEKQNHSLDILKKIFLYTKNYFSGVYEKLKQKHPDVKFGNAFALHHVLNKDLDHIVTDLAIGDFVAFSYFPVDSLNDIIKTPEQAKNDLSKVFDMAGDKKWHFLRLVGVLLILWVVTVLLKKNL